VRGRQQPAGAFARRRPFSFSPFFLPIGFSPLIIFVFFTTPFLFGFDCFCHVATPPPARRGLPARFARRFFTLRHAMLRCDAMRCCRCATAYYAGAQRDILICVAMPCYDTSTMLPPFRRAAFLLSPFFYLMPPMLIFSDAAVDIITRDAFMLMSPRHFDAHADADDALLLRYAAFAACRLFSMRRALHVHCFFSCLPFHFSPVFRLYFDFTDVCLLITRCPLPCHAFMARYSRPPARLPCRHFAFAAAAFFDAITLMFRFSLFRFRRCSPLFADFFDLMTPCLFF